MRKLVRLFLPLVGMILAFSPTSAQRTCASHDVYEQMLTNDPGFALQQQRLEEATRQFIEQGGVAAMPRTLSTQVIRIPIVFHVVYNTADQNISDARILAQLDRLNKDFRKLNREFTTNPKNFPYSGISADVEIEFCLATVGPNGSATTGIVRRQTNVSSFSTNNAVKFTAQGGSDAWDRNSYLNFWVCALGGGILGYAQFPGGNAATDGVVCDYRTVGTFTDEGPAGSYGPYSFGRTATHEVGHWLNLRHIWGDRRCGDDFVGDTPFHTDANYGCPSSNLTSTCNQNRGAPVMHMNYMDYTDDACMYMFSVGQKDRMWAIFQPGGARASLLSSNGCGVGSGGSCNTPSGLSSSNVTTNSATLSWSAVSGAVSYTVEIRPQGGSYTATTTAATSLNVGSLTPSTTYEWRVRTNCSSNNSNFSANATFVTQSDGGGGGDCEDTFEPNNTSGTAASIPLNTDISSKICSATDVDWFVFGPTNQQNRAVRVTLTMPGGAYNMRLYRPNGQLAATSSGSNDVKVITFNGNPTGNYRVEVYGSGNFSTTTNYTLRAEVGSSFREADGRMTEVGVDAVQAYPNPASRELMIRFGAEWQGTVANVSFVDQSGRRVQQQMINAAGTVRIATAQLSEGLYLLQVSNGRLSQTQKVMIRRD